MANTVNVTTANTFEQWRVKTNELGTKIGDLDEVTNSDIGAATIVAAVKAHQGIVAGSVVSTGGTVMTGDLDWADTKKAKFGDGDDLQIYHSGSNSIIRDSGTGGLYIESSQVFMTDAAGNENMFKATENGSVELYHNNVARIATNATGVDVTGVITADGLDIDDDHIIKIGTGDDLQIYHSGTHSYIADSGTGQLKVISNGTGVDIQKDETETMAKFIVDGAVKLYHNNVEKFETTAAGGTLTGVFDAGIISTADSIIHTGDTDNKIAFTTDVQKFYTGNSERLKVYATGIDVTGDAAVSGSLNAATLKYNGTDIYAASAFTTAVQTTVGAMVSNNTESGLAVTYDGTTGTLDFDVIDPVITLTGAVTGQATMTNLGSITIATSSGAGNIVTDDIADNAVTQAKMADDSVGSSEMKSLSTLLIINSAGATVKTLHGAGS